MRDNNTTQFNRTKIYEKLEYLPKPSGYNSKIPWVVQQQIAATNGKHYVDIIGKLKDYPEYDIPVPRAKKEANSILLDIGNGWGRWQVSAAKKGYIPVGIDIRLEFCETAQKVMKHHGINGYNVVADLENIPFADAVFDVVWSFSVLQHTHIKRLKNCLKHIDRILTNTGITKLEFPNKEGLRNRLGPVKQITNDIDNYNSWVVRYYSIREYQEIFSEFLDDFNYCNHSFLGIGILKEDLKYVSLKNKVTVAISLLLSQMTKILPIKKFSDSIYITAKKKSIKNNNLSVNNFIKLHNEKPTDNTNIVELLRCPISGGKLKLNKDKTKITSEDAGVYYPVINNIPVMIASEAKKI